MERGCVADPPLHFGRAAADAARTAAPRKIPNQDITVHLPPKPCSHRQSPGQVAILQHFACQTAEPMVMYANTLANAPRNLSGK
jgi:hypothetical protein